MPYLTPDQKAVRQIEARRLSVYSEYWPMIIGAIVDTLSVRHWEASGDITPEQAVQEIYLMFFGGIEDGSLNELGQVIFMAVEPDSDQYLFCDGSVYDGGDYPVYYAILVDQGSPYLRSGGNFAVPDLDRRFVRGVVDTPGGEGGEDTHQLTEAELPSHTHQWTDPGLVDVGAGTPSGIFALADPGNPFSSVGNTGGDQAHENRPAFHELLAFIKVK